MANSISGADVYGPGSWIDHDAPAVPDDALRLFESLAAVTPGFTQDKELWKSVSFQGSLQTIAPGPLKSPVIAAALHAMCGVVANELLALRDGGSPIRHVGINTDHAAFWLGCVGMAKRNGSTVRELAKRGELAGIFSKDLEKGTFATPLRLRATANYPTKEEELWYQLHGSLDADPVLRAIGLDPDAPCSGLDEAYELIGNHVRKFGAHELEAINIERGLCGSICYTPESWRQTRMSKDLSKHPLVNCKLQSHAIPTSAIPLTPGSDRRPLAGIKVVEIVRIIAGPVIGTTLAALGADVIRINCSRLPDFNSLQLTLNAGVRTLDIDFDKKDELQHLLNLIQDADIFVQGYRSGSLARRGMGLHDLLEMAGKRGKGIVYVEENCYGPDGPMHERPGWQQVADAASGCSYVTGRSLGHTDGTCVLPALPVPDMLTGLIGAIGAMMAIRDRARQGGSYHVFASLMAAAALPLQPDVGLYSHEAVKQCDERFQWVETGPELFVLELLDVVLKGWADVFPEHFGPSSPWFTQLKGEWGSFELLKPVLQLATPEESPYWSSAPEPNCHHDSPSMSWL
ncbi:hypothetical protein GQ607_010209 [Colletotrichum asianum]|uniref:Uncharacterized protein n=1 Tax=Colletotrichum asianum TaxID=702518 RepID=A0A8H3W517_9PEZI|nr:hypothetical protein GQ607_010209 [Colletotrichum asianum]